MGNRLQQIVKQRVVWILILVFTAGLLFIISYASKVQRNLSQQSALGEAGENQTVSEDHRGAG